MIKLSDRLQVIANLIENGQTMADIGTDHGFLPLYLFERKISPKVILADISKGSLQKAIDNVSANGYGGKKYNEYFNFRLGNGIEILETGEIDAVVLAGMGGILMTEILGVDLEKTRSIKKIILQPRTAQGKLRFWLKKNGFEIISENLVREGKYICEVVEIRALNDSNVLQTQLIEGNEDDIEYEAPVSLLVGNDALAAEFIEKKLRTELKIVENIKRAVEIDEEKLEKTQQRILYLENLLAKAGRENGYIKDSIN